jgi:hypothetical protein
MMEPMRSLPFVVLMVTGCTPVPSVLRSADLSAVTRIALVKAPKAGAAAAALVDELKSEVPEGHRFELVPAACDADATVAIDAQRWWLDERDLAPAPSAYVPMRVRRTETMEATFQVTFGGNVVSETYRRIAVGAPRAPDTALWNDDLTAANAVQIVAAFLGDLSLDERGAVRPARPAAPPPPAEVPAPL